MLLKSRYPQIVLWHCLNHRLELAVSDTITAVDGTQPIEDFIGKIYTIYSQSEKMQRGLKNIAAELDVQLRKVDKILTTRWVTHIPWNLFGEIILYHTSISTHFHSPRTRTKHKATYAGLIKRMETIEFVEDVAITKDSHSILSESLQKDCTALNKASE